MTPGDARIELAALRLLEAALALPSATRDAYVRDEANVPEEVRRRALTLLHSDRQMLDSLRTGGAAESEMVAAVPEMIGSYRVLRLLGRGGMGAVYLAERTAADFLHRVAIKVIRSGALSQPLIERFRRERQTLAQLNHPNIARLYDGGETESGAPYLVMEFVEGCSLAEWLKDSQPGLEARLRVFLQICDAVACAHRNLIIHRDLTPSNVLVTANETVKLIDFGIARPVAGPESASGKATFTGLSRTPGFAAPERLLGAAANTQTDIYSLGKILQLLVGAAESVELAAVAAKASADEPADRYATVEGLSAAISDWQAHKPVAAYSSHRGYRLRKFLQRETLLAGSVFVVLIALSTGVVVSTLAYARSERARAESQQRFEEVRSLARFQLFELYDRLERVVGNTGARVELARTSQAYLSILATHPRADDGLRLESAQGLIKLAGIVGVSARPNFGEFDRAIELLIQAQRQLDLVSAPDAAVMGQRATSHAYLALIYTHARSQPLLAREQIESALAALSAVPVERRDWTWMQARRTVRVAQLEFADVEADVEQLLRLADLVEADIQSWPAAERAGENARFDRAMALHFRSIALYTTDQKEQLSQGLAVNLEADAMLAALESGRPNDPDYLYRRAWNAYYGHGIAARIESDDVAEQLLDQATRAVAQLRRIEEQDQSLVTFAERIEEARAQFYAATGRYAEAISVQQDIVRGRAGKVGTDRRSESISDLAFGLAVLGGIGRQAGNRNLACESWTDGEALLLELEKRGHLRGYIAKLRPAVAANVELCGRGEPLSAFRKLTDQ
jgi:eukaryotic-like serine/threonine-protein kinase